jgi:3-oxoadipate enol-lactonase
MTGAHDVSVPPGAARALAAALPTARLEIIPQAGHMSCIEQPRLVEQHISNFLETTYGK